MHVMKSPQYECVPPSAQRLARTIRLLVNRLFAVASHIFRVLMIAAKAAREISFRAIYGWFPIIAAPKN